MEGAWGVPVGCGWRVPGVGAWGGVDGGCLGSACGVWMAGAWGGCLWRVVKGACGRCLSSVGWRVPGVGACGVLVGGAYGGWVVGEYLLR